MIRLECVADGMAFYRSIAHATMHECTGMLCGKGVPEGMETSIREAACNAIVLWCRFLIINRLAGRDVHVDSPVGRDGRSFAWAIRSATKFMVDKNEKESPQAVLRALHPCGNKLRLITNDAIFESSDSYIDSKLAHQLLNKAHLPSYLETHALWEYSCRIMGLSSRLQCEERGVCFMDPVSGRTRHVLRFVRTVCGQWHAEAKMRGPAPLMRL